MRRRLGVLTAAMFVAGAILATPATAAPAACTWTVEKVRIPAGYDAESTNVRGTDSHGNYVGTVVPPVSDSASVVLWNKGEPRVVEQLADFLYPQVVGENSAGTVLLSGHQRSTGRTGVFLYAGGHTGNGTLTYLAPPTGLDTMYAVALNERGDVLATARAKDGHSVTVLWSILSAGPLVIDTPVGVGSDLDDDGTVLLVDGNAGKGYLWRHGQIVPVTGEPGFYLYGGIRSGKVIGTLVQSWPKSQSLIWDDPATPRQIRNGGTAQAINARGLIAGSRDTLIGPPAVWRDTTLLADLPLPDGLTDDSDTYVIGDDDTIFGRASRVGPLRWTCS
jgi:hypothetical protein